MPINTTDGPLFDGAGRLVPPGQPFVAPGAGPSHIDRSAESDAAEPAGVPNANEQINATAAAIATKKAADAIADITTLDDREALAVLATDNRATVAKAAADRLAALPPAAENPTP